MQDKDPPKLPNALKKMLVRSEANLRALYNHSLHGLLSIQHDGTLESLNPAAEKILGYANDSLGGKNIRELAENPQRFPFPPKSEDPIEFLALHQDGTKRFLELRLIPLDHSYLGIFHDITKRKEVEEELKNTNIILDTITRVESQFIIQKDRSDIEEILSELLTAALAVTDSQEGFLAQIEGEGFGKIAASSEGWKTDLRNKTAKSPSFSLVSPFVQEVLETKMVVNKSDINPLGPYQKSLIRHFLSIPLIRKEKLVGLLALARSSEFYDEDEIHLLLPLLQVAIILMEDFEKEIERRKSRELLKAARDEALSGTRAMSAFLANMSHEIRTPLNIVMGMTELLLNTELTDKQKELAEKSYRSAEVLLTLINDILDLSKIEAGQLKLESLSFDLPSLIYEVLDLFGPKAKEKNLRLTAALAPGFPHQFTSDPVRIRQILTNLVGNAIKFTAKGSIEINGSPTPNGFRIEVRDTGPGIPPEKMGELFQKFRQADPSTTREFGGTGLGLAISKQLTQALGGSIGCESTPNQGSTFWFSI